MQERDPAPLPEPAFFSDTLSGTRDRVRLRHRLSAPIGLAAHGIALAAIALMSMLAVPQHLSPNAMPTTVLQFAPPAPQSLIHGDVAREASPSEASVVSIKPKPSFFIPDEMLTPVVQLDASYGAENGFNDGDVDGLMGMPGGMPGGVLGGVPGGLVGGLVGGTGTELPKFPTPDVGARPIRMPPASYTEEAIREKVRGSVKLRVVIDEKGKVEVLEVLHSVPELDAEAIRTVETSWRFEPATKNGRPVPSLGDLVVRFNLY